MVPETGEWTVPAPLRSLLWWPPIAFVLAMFQPSSAASIIAMTGAALALLGLLRATVGTSLARRLSSRTDDATEVTPVPLAPAAEMATSMAAGHRAA